MKVFVKKGDLARSESEAAVVAFFEGEEVLRGAAAAVDRECGGLIGDVLSRGDFTGRVNQISLIYPRKPSLLKRVIAVGLGKRPEITMERIRGAFARAAQQIRSLNAGEISTSLDFGNLSLPPEGVTEAVVEGVRLGLYRFASFRTSERDPIREISTLSILETDAASLPRIRAAVKTAQVIADSVCLARDLVSMPANEMTPGDLANEARRIARGTKLRCRVLGPAAMRRLGMKALLAVASGSHEPPRFIVLEYRGGAKEGPVIVFVGKGLTFDSGGISLKPAEKMDLMKDDMAGGAAVIAALQAAARLALPVNLVGLVPAAENLPGGKAYRPGDILRSLSGQTIEIVTTDAEGRLILADALTYAGRFKPAAIVDLATLTSACVVALGDHVIGMMGNDDSLKRQLREAGDLTGERVWELPLWEEYHELIRGEAADFKNSGGRAGGAITAAAFLSQFTGSYPWVHLDIAGPAWLSKEKPYIPKGASGVGVRLLLQFIRNRGDQGKGG
jgi:leucyl aminopeptidase